ncbi:hypothetical protein SARC_06274 [Sphaeroforma arctica JP610]|uniref:Uncharacterized protein n=1 Tax=Sphaeroforma arctica JP610 TaxID=667725 RepID=A0A0L0FX35_9EUKA|nr:hypothetical protein SARC_06274 [Sphaeroforma arctica JP610]KNC81410.1 hypothetical protein SARC_06274 [Sphaeroforma arctica JP610]|eukprot:XP_014155312.1 hypothetical protein SARC_06274 [Sphaeroforma arctica JP610]
MLPQLSAERHEANDQIERANRTMKDWLNKSLASGTAKDIWEACENLLKAQVKRVANATATTTELVPLEVGNIVWKCRDSIQHKDQTAWVGKGLLVVRGPYDGDQYDIRARGGRTVRAHREQLKLAVASQEDRSEPAQVLVTLKEYLYTVEWF